MAISPAIRLRPHDLFESSADILESAALFKSDRILVVPQFECNTVIPGRGRSCACRRATNPESSTRTHTKILNVRVFLDSGFRPESVLGPAAGRTRGGRTRNDGVACLHSN
jgi:hypothetical protein